MQSGMTSALPLALVGIFSVLFMIDWNGVGRVAARGSSPFFTSSCEGRVSPRKYTEPPCKIGQASYCTEPGEAYPRHAVRRFVNDNQGLMRRMYGDLRHLAVLRSEMEWNNVAEASSAFSGRKASSGNYDDAPSGDNDDYVDDETNDVNVALNTSSRNAATNPQSPVAVNGTAGDGAHNATTPLPVTATTTPPTASSNQTTSGEDNDSSSEPAEADKGINACPTRQEVVAPYWAVNTRGRTLAVVNDPPYEQHIHWEKCLHENQQMLCRDGCRCEQQFRLQRLLAFDPACDCKGVFMDWFLLPSCCVCKCFGMRYDTNSTATNNGTSVGRRTGRENNTNGSS